MTSPRLGSSRRRPTIGLAVLAAGALALAVAACDDSCPSQAPVTCDTVVDRADQCPSVQEVCNLGGMPHCGAFTCCYCEDGAWKAAPEIDCFDGCPGNVDAGVDGPVDAATSDAP